MNNQLLVRVSLGYLVVVSAQLGVWALLAPQSFFNDFPGLGRAWVAADGPYNEHLVRDVGALNLALCALLIYAAVHLTRELVTAAGIASLAWGVPHFIYHAFNTDLLPTGDAVISLVGLFSFVAFAAVLVVVARNPAMMKPVRGDARV